LFQYVVEPADVPRKNLSMRSRNEGSELKPANHSHLDPKFKMNVP
jgi:hypothetical protein